MSNSDEEEGYLDLTFSSDDEDVEVPQKRTRKRLLKRIKKVEDVSDDEVIDDEEGAPSATSFVPEKIRKVTSEVPSPTNITSTEELESSVVGDDEAVSSCSEVDTYMEMGVKERRELFVERYSSISDASVMGRILNSDNLVALKSVLANTFFAVASVGCGSSSQSAGDSFNISDILLHASIVGSPSCSEYLLSVDFDNLTANSIMGDDQDEEDEEADFGAEQCDVVTEDVSDAELQGVFVNLNQSSHRALALMRRGVASVGKSGSNKFDYHWHTPLMCALYNEQDQIVQLYCDFCPRHSLAVLLSVAPSNEEGAPVVFDLLRAKTVFTLLVALRSLDGAMYAYEAYKDKDGLNAGALDAQAVKSQRRYRKMEAKKSTAATPSRFKSSLLTVLGNTTVKGGDTLLHWACESNEMASFVEQMMYHAPSLLHMRDKRGLTPVHHACAVGCAEVLRSVIKCDHLDHTGESCVNVVDEQGWSPFLYALMREQVECAMLVLSAGQTGTALYQLRLLGRIIQPPNQEHEEVVSSTSAQIDERIRTMIKTLGTVREFRSILNKVVRSNLSLLEDDLGYILMYPSLLSLENKLLAARKILTTVHREAETEDEEYPLFRTSGIAEGVYLRRDNPWFYLCKLSGVVMPSNTPPSSRIVVANSRQHLGSSAHRQDVRYQQNNFPAPFINQKKVSESVKRFRSRIMFQFDGKEEVGGGHGVEREMIESLCKCMVTRNTQANASSSSSSNNGRSNPQSVCIFIQNEDSGDYQYPCQISPAFDSKKMLSPFFVFGQLAGHLLLTKCAAASDAKSVRHETDGAGNNVTRLVGGNFLSTNLPACFWALVLRTDYEGTLEDMESLDPTMYQSLVWIRDNTGVEGLDLYFTVPRNPDAFASSTSNHGSMRYIKEEIIELEEGGARKKVSDTNKSSYIKLMVKHHTRGRMGPQAKLVRKGLLSVIGPSLLLSLFSDSDLYVCLQGSGSISLDDWKLHTKYQNCTGLSDRRISWFWRLVNEMSGIDKSKLLMFATGTSRLPAGGFASLEPKFTVNMVPYESNTSLPTASTCFNLLKLPAYPDEASLRKNVLTAALYGSTGFSFS
jgi:ankyrin repeat protein